jgi:hypothetical protein
MRGSVNHLAMRKGIATHGVQRIAVRQLCVAQGTELLWRRLQFELGSKGLAHTRQRTKGSQI